MSRQYGTTSSGGQWDSQTIRQVFNKGLIMVATSRKDACGAAIEFSKYGDTTENGTGWEIDHIKPVAKGGTDDFGNLQALQWQNNRYKSDMWPEQNYCVMPANR